MFIDAIGKACPTPLVLTKKAFDGGESEVEIVVDNETASINLRKFAETEGLSYEVRKDGNNYVCLLKGKMAGKQSVEELEAGAGCAIDLTGNFAVFFASESLGVGSDELGFNLAKMAIYTLSQDSDLPKSILFMNGGVKLPCSDVDQIIDSLKEMEAKGVKILVCGTCLDYYGIKDQLKVGEVSNMYNILGEMKAAAKVIKL